MQTVTGLFITNRAARSAVSNLEEEGIASSDIAYVGREEPEADAHSDAATGAGAGAGAVAGGAGGLLAGLGILALPGVGPVVAAGWLAATLAGAAAGAVVGGVAGRLVGALVDAGVDQDDAGVYAEGIRRGGAIVSVTGVEEKHAEAVRLILVSNGAVDLQNQRTLYEGEGWSLTDEGNRNRGSESKK